MRRSKISTINTQKFTKMRSHIANTVMLAIGVSKQKLLQYHEKFQKLKMSTALFKTTIFDKPCVRNI